MILFIQKKIHTFSYTYTQTTHTLTQTIHTQTTQTAHTQTTHLLTETTHSHKPHTHSHKPHTHTNHADDSPNKMPSLRSFKEGRYEDVIEDFRKRKMKEVVNEKEREKEREKRVSLCVLWWVEFFLCLIFISVLSVRGEVRE